jgi:hypothetical protein
LPRRAGAARRNRPFAYRSAGGLPTSSADHRGIVYAIDSHDRLTAFDPAFRSFAAASGAAGLPDEWLGRSLWESTASSEINMVIRSLVGRARQGQLVSVPTRCDSPHVERFVQMEIAARPDGEVRFTLTVTRARFTGELADARLHVCRWCFRAVPGVTHGTCPDCLVPQLDEADSSILPSPFVRISSPL